MTADTDFPDVSDADEDIEPEMFEARLALELDAEAGLARLASGIAAARRAMDDLLQRLI